MCNSLFKQFFTLLLYFLTSLYFLVCFNIKLIQIINTYSEKRGAIFKSEIFGIVTVDLYYHYVKILILE